MAISFNLSRLLRTQFTGLSFRLCCSRFISTDQICIKAFGDPPKVLFKRTIDFSPKLKENDVLVKMLMSPINPSDVNTIEGTYFIKPQLPAVLGNEGVGEIVDVGTNVRGLNSGDLVIPSITSPGTWQTYRIANQEEVIKLPRELRHLSAATISVNPTTAYRMLKDFVNISPGDVVIQNGANSGVGISVIQLAKEWNIKTINIIRDRPEIESVKKELTALGADYVVTEDFARSTDMKNLLNSLPSKPKLAFNCVGGKSATELLRCIDHGGVIVTYGGMSKKPIIVPTGALLFKEVTLLGYWNTKWNSQNSNSITRFEMFADLCDLIQKGKLHPPKCEFFHLNDFEKAMQKATQNFKGIKAVFLME